MVAYEREKKESGDDAEEGALKDSVKIGGDLNFRMFKSPDEE